MRYETHVVNDIHARRFVGKEPKYALLISHGVGGHSGIYNKFCEVHAARGADVWAYDAPGHGLSTMTRGRGDFQFSEWVDACVNYGQYIKDTTGLPVFAMGSSLGTAATSSAFSADPFTGAIMMGGAAVPGYGSGPLAPDNCFHDKAINQLIELYGKSLRWDIGIFVDFDKDYGYRGAHEQKKSDPLNTWSYTLESLKSLFTYKLRRPLEENKKPVLFAVGDGDPFFPVATVQAVASKFGGPVEVKVFENAGHQLMMFNTEQLSAYVKEWAEKILG